MKRKASKYLRLQATFCHLSGLTWISTLLLIPGKWEFSYTQISWGGFLVLFPLLTPVFTRGSHRFVNVSARKIFNFYLSQLLYALSLIIVIVALLLMFSPLLIACISMGLNSATSSAPNSCADNSFISTLLFAIFMPFYMIENSQYFALAYAVNISVALFQTWRGKIFSYPLTISFMGGPKKRR